MNTWLLALRSVILWAVSVLYLFVTSSIIVFVSMFKDPRKTDGLSRVLLRRVLRTAGVKIRIRHSRRVDPKRTAIFVCNHVNIFDPFVLYSSIPPFFRGMELQSHYKIPAYGWMLKRFRHIPIPKQFSRETLKILERRIKTNLDSGVSVVFFPEGHRTRDGSVAEFQRGVFRMSRTWGYPVAPMTITGSYEFKRCDSWMLRPSTIHVYLHEYIEPQQVEKMSSKQLVEHLHEIISAPVESAAGRVPWNQKLLAYREVASPEDILLGTDNPRVEPTDSGQQGCRSAAASKG